MDKARAEPLLDLTSGSKLLVASRVGCNGLQLCGCQDFAKDLGRGPLGRRLALPGPMGQCASAHSIQRGSMGRMASSFSSLSKKKKSRRTARRPRNEGCVLGQLGLRQWRSGLAEIVERRSESCLKAPRAFFGVWFGLSESFDFVTVPTFGAFFEMRVFPLLLVCLFVLCIVQEVERRACTF